MRRTRSPAVTDYLADIGIWVVKHVPGAGPSKDPGGFVYERLGLGTFRLSQALRLHWLFAYLFMANGLLYVLGLALGAGYRRSCRGGPTRLKPCG